MGPHADRVGATTMTDATAPAGRDESTRIRRYDPRDYDAVSRVCLETADAGDDATGHYSSDDLMPDIYARPYVVLEPRFAWVVEDGGAARGYIVCAPDTRVFVDRYRAEWLPGLSRRYPADARLPESERRLRADGLTPERMLLPEVDEYPAHLHIDLLPDLQGRGWGRRLIETLVDALRAEQVPGLHLSLAASNTGARAFYDRLGFAELPSSRPHAPALGLRIG
jgi:ribosomal protein S18 acetylase RimI-like enzyme